MAADTSSGRASASRGTNGSFSALRISVGVAMRASHGRDDDHGQGEKDARGGVGGRLNVITTSVSFDAIFLPDRR